LYLQLTEPSKFYPNLVHVSAWCQVNLIRFESKGRAREVTMRPQQM